MGLHAISAVSPEARSPRKKPGFSGPSRGLPRLTPLPFSMIGPGNPFLRPAFAERLKGVAVPSKGAAHGVWLPSQRRKSPRPRKRLSASHAPGLRSSEPFSGTEARTWFPMPIRSYASPPNPVAWRRRFSGLCSRNQPCIQRSTVCQRSSEAVALLSFSASRVFDRRTREKSPSLLPPLSSFPSRPREVSGTGTSGAPFQRPGISLLVGGYEPVWHFRPTASAVP